MNKENNFNIKNQTIINLNIIIERFFEKNKDSRISEDFKQDYELYNRLKNNIIINKQIYKNFKKQNNKDCKEYFDNFKKQNNKEYFDNLKK